VTPEDESDAPGPALALVSAVCEKLAPPPSKLPGAVLVSAVMPTSLNEAARFAYAGPAPSRPIWTLPPRCLAALAAVPVTCAKAIDVVGFEGCSTRYEVPALVDRLNVAAVVAATTTAPLEPLTTWTCWPGHGFFTVIVPVEPAWIAAVASVPLSTWTSTFEPPCTYTVPDTSQPLGQAGAKRSWPS